MGKHSAPEPELEYLNSLFNADDGRRSPFGYCVAIEDGLDGYAVHDEKCRSVGQGWSGPNSSCVGGSGGRYSGIAQPWEERGYAFREN